MSPTSPFPLDDPDTVPGSQSPEMQPLFLALGTSPESRMGRREEVVAGSSRSGTVDRPSKGKEKQNSTTDGSGLSLKKKMKPSSSTGSAPISPSLASPSFETPTSNPKPKRPRPKPRQRKDIDPPTPSDPHSAQATAQTESFTPIKSVLAGVGEVWVGEGSGSGDKGKGEGYIGKGKGKMQDELVLEKKDDTGKNSVKSIGSTSLLPLATIAQAISPANISNSAVQTTTKPFDPLSTYHNLANLLLPPPSPPSEPNPLATPIASSSSNNLLPVPTGNQPYHFPPHLKHQLQTEHKRFRKRDRELRRMDLREFDAGICMRMGMDVGHDSGLGYGYGYNHSNAGVEDGFEEQLGRRAGRDGLMGEFTGVEAFGAEDELGMEIDEQDQESELHHSMDIDPLPQSKPDPIANPVNPTSRPPPSPSGPSEVEAGAGPHSSPIPSFPLELPEYPTYYSLSQQATQAQGQGLQTPSPEVGDVGRQMIVDEAYSEAKLELVEKEGLVKDTAMAMDVEMDVEMDEDELKDINRFKSKYGLVSPPSSTNWRTSHVNTHNFQTKMHSDPKSKSSSHGTGLGEDGTGVGMVFDPFAPEYDDIVGARGEDGGNESAGDGSGEDDGENEDVQAGMLRSDMMNKRARMERLRHQRNGFSVLTDATSFTSTKKRRASERSPSPARSSSPSPVSSPSSRRSRMQARAPVLAIAVSSQGSTKSQGEAEASPVPMRKKRKIISRVNGATEDGFGGVSVEGVGEKDDDTVVEASSGDGDGTSAGNDAGLEHIIAQASPDWPTSSQLHSPSATGEAGVDGDADGSSAAFGPQENDAAAENADESVDSLDMIGAEAFAAVDALVEASSDNNSEGKHGQAEDAPSGEGALATQHVVDTGADDAMAVDTVARAVLKQASTSQDKGKGKQASDAEEEKTGSPPTATLIRSYTQHTSVSASPTKSLTSEQPEQGSQGEMRRSQRLSEKAKGKRRAVEVDLSRMFDDVEVEDVDRGGRDPGNCQDSDADVDEENHVQDDEGEWDVDRFDTQAPVNEEVETEGVDEFAAFPWSASQPVVAANDAAVPGHLQTVDDEEVSSDPELEIYPMVNVASLPPILQDFYRTHWCRDPRRNKEQAVGSAAQQENDRIRQAEAVATVATGGTAKKTWANTTAARSAASNAARGVVAARGGKQGGWKGGPQAKGKAFWIQRAIRGKAVKGRGGRR